MGAVVLFGAIYVAYLWNRYGANEALSYLPFVLLIAGAIIFVAPRLIEEKGLPIRGFGVMLLIAVSSGVGISAYRARQMGVDSEVIYSLAFWFLVCGMIGARLFFVIEYWKLFLKPTVAETIAELLNFLQGGIVLYGALIGSCLAAFWYFRKHQYPVLPTFDLIAPGMALGVAFGRLGCLLNGCCFGGACAYQPIAVTFPPRSPPYERQFELGLFHGLRLADSKDGVILDSVIEGSSAAKAGLERGDKIDSVGGIEVKKTSEFIKAIRERKDPDAVSIQLKVRDRTQTVELEPQFPARSIPIHATQIYDSLNCFLICAILWFYYPFRRRDGEVLALLLGLYAVSRFLIEIIRIDEPGQLGTNLSISQLLSIGFVLLAAAILAYGEWKRAPLALPMRPIS